MIYQCLICNSFYGWLRCHIGAVHGLSGEEYVLKYFYNGIRPLCKCGCGELTTFQKGKYNLYLKTHSDNLIKEKIRIKKEQTCLKKYGVKNVFQSEETKNKIKQYNLLRYGIGYS